MGQLGENGLTDGEDGGIIEERARHYIRGEHGHFMGSVSDVFLEDGYQTCIASDHRFTYRIDRTEKTVLPKTYNVYDEIQSEFYRTVDIARFNNRNNPDFNPDLDGFHYAVKDFADKYGFRYQRKEL